MRQCGELIKGRETSEPVMLLGTGEGRAPEGHDPIANIFVDNAIIIATGSDITVM